MPRRRSLTVVLDAEHAAKLARLTERTNTRAGTLAQILLSRAIDEAAIDARHIVDLLDGIPGAFERAGSGLEQARSEKTIALDDL